MGIDLIIKNGFLVSLHSIIKADLGINGEKIVIIGKGDSMPHANKVLDVEGNYIIPGCIDVHVHFREPLREDKENWSSGSKSAACGGVTTVLDMPESVEPTIEDLNKKATQAEDKSVVDFGLYGRPINSEDVKDLYEAGVIGYKILLGYEQFRIDDGTFYQILNRIGETNLPAVVHAEDIIIVRSLQERLILKGEIDIDAHERSRPIFVEEEAISKSIILANAAGCKLHIAHVSSVAGVDIIKRAKNNGRKVTAETCPHYLMLKKSDLERLGPYGKINPPVRGTKKDINGLWMGLLKGSIDCISTDHAPHLIQEKEVGWENIFEAAPGVIGVQTMLPLMLTEVNNGLLSLMKLVELTSTNPAKIFNVYPKKGTIQVGSDADLVVIDMEKKGVIRTEDQFSKMPFTPYNGWQIQGCPMMTMIRGEIVAENGEIKAEPGYGEWIKPKNKSHFI